MICEQKTASQEKTMVLFAGPSVRATEQRGQCVQPGFDDIPRPSGAVPHHQGPPATNTPRDGGQGTARRGRRQVGDVIIFTGS